MRQAVELIVFDWDGTLMDSAARIVSSLRVAASRVGLPCLPDARLRSIIGLGLDAAMADLYPLASVEQERELVRAYRQHFMHECQEEERLFEGVEQVLDSLNRTVPWLAVATGKSRAGLDRALCATGLEHYFPFTRCADEAPSKPNPQMLEDIMHSVAAEPASTLMVGDTEFDLAMAREAGVRSVGVTYGVHPSSRLLSQEPLCLIDTISQLPTLVEQLGLSAQGQGI